MKSGTGPAAAALLLLGCLPVAEPAAAAERTGVLAGYTLPPSAKILLLRPKILVGEQSTGGLFEPNADWTEQSKANIVAALAAQQSQLGNEIVTVEEPIGDDAQKLADYRALFAVLVESVLRYQFSEGYRLPTKRDGVFEWSVGPEIRDMPGIAGVDYVLLIYTQDDYGSTGRKVAQIASIFSRHTGRALTSGVHMGYAGLIDAKTGNLVWLNVDERMAGDVRSPDGAQRRVGQLLEGFPTRSPSAAAAAPAGVAVAH